MDGYSKWMATPSVWLSQVDGYSEWMVISNGWLFRVDGYSEWVVAAPYMRHYGWGLPHPRRDMSFGWVTPT